MSLDMRTLFFVYFSLMTIFSVYLALIWVKFKKEHRGIGLFLVSMLVLTIGNLGIALQGYLHPFVTIVLSNTFFTICIVLVYESFRRFFGVKKTSISSTILALLPFFTFIEQYYFGIILPDLSVRLIAVSLFWVIAAAFTLRLLFVCRKQGSLPGYFLMSSFACTIAVFLVRIFITLLTHPSGSFLLVGGSQTLIACIFSLLECTWPIGFALLIAYFGQEKATAESRRYSTLMESLPQMIFVKDRESKYRSCNRNYAAALGISPGDIEEKDDYDYYPREAADKYRADDQLVMTSGTSMDVVEKWPGPRGEIWVNTVKTPISDEKGHVTGVIGIFWDVSERIRLEKERERSLKEKEILLQEINHRVKNNLQLISAMLRLESGKSPIAAVDKFVKDTESRIMSIAVIHEMLYIKDDVSEIQVVEYMNEISRNLVAMYSRPECPVKINVETGDLRLDLNRMVPLGLITNEMMTNSLKYAFLGKETGTITIAMTSDVHSQEYVFIFKDDGIGLPEFFDVLTSKNLGMTFIHSLSQQLDGVYCH